jgi:hypothetical protein
MGRRVINRYFLVLYGFFFLVFIAIGCVKEEDLFVKRNFMVEPEEGLAPLYATKRIENLSENANYIIVLKDEIDWSDIDFESDKIEQFISSQRNKTFKYALKGFTIKLTSKDLKKVRKDPNVKYFEPIKTLACDMNDTSSQISPVRELTFALSPTSNNNFCANLGSSDTTKI